MTPATSDPSQTTLRQLAKSRYPLYGIGLSALLLAIVIWGAVATRITTERDISTRAIETQNDNLALTYEAAVDASLRRVEDLLQLAAERGVREAEERLRPTAEISALVSFIVEIDAKGEVLLAAGREPPARWQDAEFVAALQAANLQAPTFARPFEWAPGGRLLFALGRRLTNTQGQEVSLIAGLDPRYYYDLFERARLGPHGVVALIGFDAIVRARAGYPNAIAGQNLADSALFELIKTQTQGHYLAPGGNDHPQRLLSYRVLPHFPMIITVGVSKEAAFADWTRRRDNYLLGAALATLLIAAATAGWLYFVLLQRRWSAEIETIAQNYQRLFNDNPLPMWVFDPASHAFLEVNQAATAHYGYSREEFLGMRIDDIRPPEELPRLQEYLADHPKLRGSSGVWRHRRKNGQIITVHLTRDEVQFQGKTARLIVVEDITQEIAARERLTLALDTSRTAIWEWNVEDNSVYLSEQVYELLDYPPTGIDLTQGLMPLVAPEDRDHLKGIIHRLLHDPAVSPEFEGELRGLTGSGARRWLRYQGRCHGKANGKPVRLLGVVVDIDARKRAETELRRSEERFRHVFQTISVGYAQSEFEDGTLRLVNPGLVRLLGAKNERELLGRRSVEFFGDASERERFKQILLADGHVDNFPVTLRRVDGSPLHVLLSDFLVRGTQGEPTLIEGVLIDVTPLKEAELALRKSKETLQAILDATLESLILVDREGRILALNATAARRFGSTPDQLLGTRLDDRYSANIAAQRRAWISEVLQSGRALIGEDERNTRIYSTHHYPVRDEAGLVQAVVLFSLDVTEKRRSEAALAESEARLRALVGALPDWVFTTDADGRLIEWLSGQFPEGMATTVRAGAELSNALPIAEDRGLIAAIRSCAAGGEPIAREFSLHAPGAETWYEMRATRVAKPAGAETTVVCVARNVTARHDTEAQMAAARRRLLNTLESMLVGVLEVGLDGHIRYANAAACEILECTAEEIFGQHFQHDLGRRWRQIDGEGNPLQPEEVSLRLTLDQSLPVRQFDTGIRDPQGRIKWLHLNSMPILDQEGRVSAAVLNFEDVTEARDALRALRESSRLNRQIISSASEGIVVVDARLRYIVWNPSMESLSGVAAANILGKHIEDGLHFAGKERINTAYRRALAGEFVDVPDVAFTFAESGKSGWAHGRHSPLRDGGGNIVGVIAVVTDITERKARGEEIAQLNATLEQRVRDRTAELEAVNRELESFSYSVSHDLRAPLRSIDGFSELLLAQYAGQLDETGRRFLQRVRANTQHMAILIDQLLELARVARAEVHRQPVDLTAVGRAIAHTLQAQQPDRVVDWRIAEELKTHADPQLLRNVLENLLGNAWKFTVQRTPAVIELGEDTDAAGAHFFVRDNGAGFDMAYASKLFGAFQRLHRPEEFPGTGVGLASVKRIVTMHGGRVWAEAAPDQGACFRFTLG